jgi:hypothetical protein
MRETRLYGSVRGAAGNSRPYRELRSKLSIQLGATLFWLCVRGSSKGFALDPRGKE